MTADDTGSWEARYRRSLAEEEDQLDQFADGPTGQMMRFRTAYGLVLVLVGAVIGAVALVDDGRPWALAAGVAALVVLALVVLSVVVSLVRGCARAATERSPACRARLVAPLTRRGRRRRCGSGGRASRPGWSHGCDGAGGEVRGAHPVSVNVRVHLKVKDRFSAGRT